MTMKCKVSKTQVNRNVKKLKKISFLFTTVYTLDITMFAIYVVKKLK